MRAVILAGGLGTRLSEETVSKPKPMVEVGGKPILWHIMKTYEAFGINDFIICSGHLGYVIKEYFAIIWCIYWKIWMISQTLHIIRTCSDLRIVPFIDLPIVVYIPDNVNKTLKSC